MAEAREPGKNKESRFAHWEVYKPATGDHERGDESVRPLRSRGRTCLFLIVLFAINLLLSLRAFGGSCYENSARR